MNTDFVAIGMHGRFDRGEPIVELTAINHLVGGPQVIPESTLQDLLAQLGFTVIYDAQSHVVYAVCEEDDDDTAPD